VQKYIDDQVSRNKRLEEGEAKREEVRKRLVEKQKALALAREEKMKQRALREAKTAEILLAGRAKQREGARDVMRKLTDGFDKAQKHLSEKANSWDKVREERHHRLEGVAVRREKATQVAQEEMVRLYLEKEQKIMQRLEDQKEKTKSKAADGGDKYAEKPGAASHLTEKQQAGHLKPLPTQADKEAAFKRSAEGMVRAHEVVKKANEDRSRAVKEALEKRFGKKDERMQAVRTERVEKRKKILEKLASKDQGPATEKVAEEVRRKAEQRELMEDMVAQNIQRLDRANEFAREQLLVRIQQNVARVDGMAEQRHQHQLQRIQLMKEAVIERSHVQETLRTMKGLPRTESPPPPQETK